MKKVLWVVMAGWPVVGCFAQDVSSQTLEERILRLEQRFEQEAAAREAKLLKRIDELEEQVKELSEESTAPVAVRDESIIQTRMDSLEEQVAILSEEQDYNPLKGITLGGYGELHYNALSGSGGASDKREIDFHRFVLMVGKEFNERIRFQSELELEHSLSGDGEPGEVELEQAYVDFDLNDHHTARAGLFLLPVGLLNETHEPTRFYGVERNPIEKNILPTTWWEAGAGLYGQLSDSVNYAVYLHSGLATSGADSYSVRSGRQKAAKAHASDPAATAALSYSIPGVTVGGSVNVQGDVTQGEAGAEKSEAWMGEIHLDLARGPWGLRALYAQWNLEGDAPAALGADRQFGWYIEPSYRITDTLSVFARYNQWDNTAGSNGSAGGKEQVDVGVNWKPHEQVVLKADYQWQNNENGQDQDGLNLGVGYEF
ncbi:porin [Tichowtungia aerotolerans]|uniref:Porin n=1 Tax=Tichowtungia aerotolerans TaxID=2697043 RepID=A0A6P1M823_9BACT|nr:porin [Tichowtungia aerotolerans]QHI68308.1 porin [Tichowtungia aerotolerans]